MMMDDDYDDCDDCDGDHVNDWYFLTEFIVWGDEHCEMLMDKTLHQIGASRSFDMAGISSILQAGLRPSMVQVHVCSEDDEDPGAGEKILGPGTPNDSSSSWSKNLTDSYNGFGSTGIVSRPFCKMCFLLNMMMIALLNRGYMLLRIMDTWHLKGSVSLGNLSLNLGSC